MTKVKLILEDHFDFAPDFAIDGKAVKFKKERVDGYAKKVWTSDVESQDGKLDISVTRYYPIAGKNWLLNWFLYFMISVFGLFGPRFDKRTTGINYVCSVESPQSETPVEIGFRLRAPQAGTKAFDFKSSVELALENDSNVFYAQEELARRTKIAKRLSWMGFVVAVVAIIVIAIVVL